jgi:ATP-binding cassette, subfamily B, bacterial PglK
VPQQIYLTDDTIAANIAYGVDREDIDQQALVDSALKANLHDFIINELPKGYDTVIGDRGVRLSGGQRQRIGLARAIYHRPQILVLDEATSALDNLTEQSVIESLGKLGHKMTVIIIAHRLNTLLNCDLIYLIDQGRVVASGKFNELNENNQMFKAMASTINCKQDFREGLI